jgi:ferritin-like metal-binding protein YciE
MRSENNRYDTVTALLRLNERSSWKQSSRSVRSKAQEAREQITRLEQVLFLNAKQKTRARTCDHRINEGRPKPRRHLRACDT